MAVYPTASNTIAGNTIGVADSANYYDGNFAKFENSLPTYLTDGGVYGANSASFYGTYDQGGNVWEWNDAVIGSSRGIRGGAWNDAFYYLQSSGRYDYDPMNEDDLVGFRVASVPEPSTAMLMLMGGGAWLLWRRRKATL